MIQKYMMYFKGEPSLWSFRLLPIIKYHNFQFHIFPLVLRTRSLTWSWIDIAFEAAYNHAFANTFQIGRNL